MLESVDGVVVAVSDVETAFRTFATLVGSESDEPMPSRILGADLTPLYVGTSRILLATPTQPGPVASALERWGEGLVGCVLSSTETMRLPEHLGSRGVGFTDEEELLHVDPDATDGLRTIVVPHVDRPGVGRLSFLYEVTHLTDRWQESAGTLAAVFGLDPDRFSDISSERYGYEGVLTLFDPPARLDRMEVVHPYDETEPMGRFFSKRGRGPYMCFAECPDVPALASRLDEAGVRWAPGAERDGRPESLFVHPSGLHGVLLGVSRTDLAWSWSGRPELAGAQSEEDSG